MSEVIKKAKEGGAKTAEDVKAIIDDVVTADPSSMKTSDLKATMEKLAPSLVKGVVDIAVTNEAEEKKDSNEAE